MKLYRVKKELPWLRVGELVWVSGQGHLCRVEDGKAMTLLAEPYRATLNYFEDLGEAPDWFEPVVKEVVEPAVGTEPRTTIIKGDRVNVFWSSRPVLHNALVVYAPLASGDSWTLLLEDGETVVYVQQFEMMERR